MASTCIKISVPEDTVKSVTPTPKISAQKNTKIGMLLISVGKISKKLHTGLRQRRRQEHLYLFAALFSISMLIPLLALLQHNFMKSVEKELLSIKKMSSADYRADNIPSINLDDSEEVLDAVVSNSQLDNFFANIEFDSKGIPNDAMAVATEKQTAEGIMKLFDGTGAKVEMKSIEQTIGDVEESQEAVPSTLIPDLEYLEDEESEQSDKTVDYMKIDVIFKMYAYIYAFYISIIFLMVVQFMVVVRMHTG